jgi:phenylacetic acid degradation operon negative regulatory protein
MYNEGMTTSSSLSDDLKLILHEQERLRLWSVIITIMGEVVDASDGEIALDELIFMGRLLDVEPQAVRKALLRLTEQSWMDYTSGGESDIYRFTERGLEQTRHAMQAVYRPPRESHMNWGLGILPEGEEGAEIEKLVRAMSRAHPIIMNKQVALWEKERETGIEEQALGALTRFDELPQKWPQDLWNDVLPRPQVKLVNQLNDIVEFAGKSDISAEDALVVRVLLIHFWRRLVLLHPPILSPFDEALWPLPRLHRTIAGNYHQLCEKSDAALSRAPDMAARGERFNH